MEYISAEEFLKQPVEVQKVFWDWWQPEILEPITFKTDDFEGSIVCVYKDNQYLDVASLDNEVEEICINKKCKDEVIPLLTEGQLRKFIEDKTGGIIQIEKYIGTTGYDIKTLNYKDDIYESIMFENLGNDLLKAYWKVAIEIAKEGI